MRRPIRTLRLAVAAVVIVVGLMILGVGAALASPGGSHRPVKVEHHSKLEKPSRTERSDRMRDR